jgi:hypothetical protein
MIGAATNKLLHAPVTRLRGVAGEPRAEDYLAALTDLFELDTPGLRASKDEADAFEFDESPKSLERAVGERDAVRASSPSK